MILGHTHEMFLGHGQQLNEVPSKFNITIKSYSQGNNFGYVCTVMLTLDHLPNLVCKGYNSEKYILKRYNLLREELEI